eukprot:scaffold114028_cov14-Prasinocladus_malaysianus.AAC.2
MTISRIHRSDYSIFSRAFCGFRGILWLREYSLEIISSLVRSFSAQSSTGNGPPRHNAGGQPPQVQAGGGGARAATHGFSSPRRARRNPQTPGNAGGGCSQQPGRATAHAQPGRATASTAQTGRREEEQEGQVITPTPRRRHPRAARTRLVRSLAARVPVRAPAWWCGGRPPGPAWPSCIP